MWHKLENFIDLKQTLAPLSNGRDANELRCAFKMLQSVARLMSTSGIVFVAAVKGWTVGGGAEVR